MICPRCGTQINQGNTCPSCGYVVTSKGTTNAPKSTGSSSTPSPKLIMLKIVFGYIDYDLDYEGEEKELEYKIPLNLFPQAFYNLIDKLYDYSYQFDDLIKSLGGYDAITNLIINLDYSAVQEGDVLIKGEGKEVYFKIEVEKKA